MAQSNQNATAQKTLAQVGALPIRFENGQPKILLLTSRGTKRWVIPKGWPMDGLSNRAAAAQEAKEEAGVIGKPHKEPVGSFVYFKRRAGHFTLCCVEVYLLDYEKQLEKFREKGQRTARWFSICDAAEQVDEPGLVALLRKLELTFVHQFKSKTDWQRIIKFA
jgi:ADP-ribose pyrophosphatase YjhB (NUDIX family)